MGMVIKHQQDGAQPNPLLDGKTLRLARVVKGLTQRRLGALSGVPSDRIWRIENGVIAPSEDDCLKLWGALST